MCYKRDKYWDKINEILSASPFEACNGEIDDLTIKNEKLINSSLHQLMKQGKINEKNYHMLRTTGLRLIGADFEINSKHARAALEL